MQAVMFRKCLQWQWQQLLLLSLFSYIVPLSGAASSSLAFMALVEYGSSQEVAADNGLEAPDLPRRRRQQRGRTRQASQAKPEDGMDCDPPSDQEYYDEQCFLCCASIEAGEEGHWRHFHLHKSGCLSALRCHNSLLRGSSQAARDADAARFESNPEAWKRNVLRLMPPASGNRNATLLRTYGGELESFAEDYTQSGHLLLPKNRFKAYHKFWDSWNSDSASDEFERRLEEQSSDYANSDGEAQVFTKENSSVRTRQGVRLASSSGTGSGGGGSCRQGGGGDQRRRDRGSRGGDCRPSGHCRRRSRSPAGSGNRRRRSVSESVADMADRTAARRRPGRLAVEPRPRQQLSPGPSSNGSARSTPANSPPAAKMARGQQQLAFGRSAGSNPCGSGSGGGGGSGGIRPSSGRRRLSSKSTSMCVELVETEAEAEDDSQAPTNATLSFLATKARLKKEIQAELVKRSAKNYVVPQLKSIVSKLSEEHKAELRRTADVDALDKNYQQFLKALKDLQSQLADVDQDFVGLAKRP